MYQFARDAAVAEAWLIAQEPYLMSSELGHTIDEVENLIKKHEAFEKSAAAQEERFIALRRLTTVSRELKLFNHYQHLFESHSKKSFFSFEFSLSSKKSRDVKMQLKKPNVSDSSRNKMSVQRLKRKLKLPDWQNPKIHMMLLAHQHVKQVNVSLHFPSIQSRFSFLHHKKKKKKLSNSCLSA